MTNAGMNIKKSSAPKIIHPIAGAVAMALIATFIVSTVWAEFVGDPSILASVKRAILYGIGILIPAAILAGGSGFKMVKRIPKKGVLPAKAKRMKVIAANGVLVLLPCAVTLDHLASSGDFGILFTMIQAIELIAGPLNLILMGLNMRDGLAMTRKRRTKAAAA